MTARGRLGLTLGAVAVAASALTLLAVRARAAGVPDVEALTYTGYLEGADGVALDGTHSIAVRFWESIQAEDSLCAAEDAGLELVAGRFQLALPKKCADAVKASPDVFADVVVDGSSLGRTKLGAVPYALEAGHATSADTASEAAGALAEQLGKLEDGVAAVPKITAWTDYGPALVTSAGTAVTAAKSSGRWRRVGDSVEVMATVRVVGDVASSEYITWPLPNALVPVAPADSITVGVAELWSGSLTQTCVVGLSTDSRLYLDCHGTGGAVTRGQVGPSPKFSYLSARFVVPIKNWTLTTP
jgi:hypothetical protein